jgi:hypothetical protein
LNIWEFFSIKVNNEYGIFFNNINKIDIFVLKLIPARK